MAILFSNPTFWKWCNNKTLFSDFFLHQTSLNNLLLIWWGLQFKIRPFKVCDEMYITVKRIMINLSFCLVPYIPSNLLKFCPKLGSRKYPNNFKIKKIIIIELITLDRYKSFFIIQSWRLKVIIKNIFQNETSWTLLDRQYYKSTVRIGYWDKV